MKVNYDGGKLLESKKKENPRFISGIYESHINGRDINALNGCIADL